MKKRMSRYQKQQQNNRGTNVINYDLSLPMKILLVLTFWLWGLPFLITNGILGLLMSYKMQHFKRNGASKNAVFVGINVNSRAFYNRDMIVNNAPQLTISDDEWQAMAPQDIVITSNDNYQLAAFVFINKQPNHNNKWVIVSHGWQQNRYWIWYLAQPFYAHGYNIITYDMRGHGSNDAKTNITFGDQEAVDLYAIIKYVNHYCVNNNIVANITLIGNSMGATTTLETISRLPVTNLGVRAAIFDCGYDSFSHISKIFATKFFKMHWWWSFWGLKFFLALKGNKALKNVHPLTKLSSCSHIPVLFIHGDDDQTVPVVMAQNCYDGKICYEQPVISELLIIKQAGHIRAITTDYETYCQKTLSFAAKYTNINNDNKIKSPIAKTK